MSWTDLVGMVGVAFVLGTYALLQAGRMTAEGRPYSAFNAAGAALILVSLSRNFNLASFMIESAWLLISLYGLWRLRPGSNARVQLESRVKSSGPTAGEGSIEAP